MCITSCLPALDRKQREAQLTYPEATLIRIRFDIKYFFNPDTGLFKNVFCLFALQPNSGADNALKCIQTDQLYMAV